LKFHQHTKYDTRLSSKHLTVRRLKSDRSQVAYHCTVETHIRCTNPTSSWGLYGMYG